MCKKRLQDHKDELELVKQVNVAKAAAHYKTLEGEHEGKVEALQKTTGRTALALALGAALTYKIGDKISPPSDVTDPMPSESNSVMMAGILISFPFLYRLLQQQYSSWYLLPQAAMEEKEAKSVVPFISREAAAEGHLGKVDRLFAPLEQSYMQALKNKRNLEADHAEELRALAIPKTRQESYGTWYQIKHFLSRWF